MTQDEQAHLVEDSIRTRVREGVTAVLEQVREEEMSEPLRAGQRECTPARRGEDV